MTMTRHTRCPRCATDQARAKLRLQVFGRASCTNCGLQLKAAHRAVLDGLIGGGLSVVPLALFLAWANSSLLWLLLPLIWGLGLHLVALHSLPLKESDHQGVAKDIP